MATPVGAYIDSFLMEGLDASKPAAGSVGRWYWATDTKILYKDNGASWIETARGETAIRLAQLAEKIHASLTGKDADDHPQYLNTARHDVAERHPLSVLDPSVCSETEVASVLYRYGGLFWHTLFESLDGFDPAVTETGAITPTPEYLEFTTGTTSGSFARLRKYPAYEIADLTWDKNRRVKTRVWIRFEPSREIWIVTGEYSTYKHIGFKVIDNTLYGTVADGLTENSLNIQDITEDITPVLEAVLTAGSQVEFFVDGVSKGTLSANIPTETQNSHYLIRIVFTTTAAENKTFLISEWRFLQEE